MTTSSQIQRLAAEHITSAVELVRASFDARILPYMIYGQQGIARYIEASQPLVGVASHRDARVVIDSDEVIAYAEFDLRRAPAAHLSYVCVAASHRGRGLARQLISAFASDHGELTTLSLDVFDDNTAARAVYQKLGLEAQGEVSEWTVRPLPEAVVASLVIEDLPQSLATQSVFGFSSLRIRRDDGFTVLGRLGDTCLRVSSRADYFNDDLLAKVKGAFPMSREALLIAPVNKTADLPGSAGKILARSIRMSGPLGSGLSGGA